MDQHNKRILPPDLIISADTTKHLLENNPFATSMLRRFDGFDMGRYYQGEEGVFALALATQDFLDVWKHLLNSDFFESPEFDDFEHIQQFIESINYVLE